MNHACYRSTFPVSAADLYAWHEHPSAFERLSPPWQDVRLIESPDRLENGSRAIFELKQGPLSKRWVAEHFDVTPGQAFHDRQVEGPFAHWKHAHRCETNGPLSSILCDEIEYELPLAPVSQGLAGRWTSTQLDRLFFYRHRVIQSHFRHYGSTRPGEGRTVLISGHRGLIGSRLVPLLRLLGFSVRGLSRTPKGSDAFSWDPQNDQLDPAALEGVDAVIHLAGENVAGGRWTDDRRKRILESREHGTSLIARRMAECPTRPAVLISASGVNFYPDDGTPSQEGTASGSGFLSEVCRRWETAADPARAAGIRVVHPRLGVVLTPEGGALGKMLPAFLAGGGGPIGSGKQHFPWVSIEDVLGVIVAALLDEDYTGPLNVAAPGIVSQREFATTLAGVLRRPSVVPLPARAVRAVFGKMGEETLLADLHIIPEGLERLGYKWREPQLEDALRLVLGRPKPEDVPST